MLSWCSFGTINIPVKDSTVLDWSDETALCRQLPPTKVKGCTPRFSRAPRSECGIYRGCRSLIQRVWAAYSFKRNKCHAAEVAPVD